MPAGDDSMPNSAGSVSRRRWKAVLLYGLSLLLLLLGIASVIRAQYQAEFRVAEQRLESKAALVVDLVESTFSTRGQSLFGLSDMLTSGELPEQTALSERLGDHDRTLPYIDDLIIADLSGRIMARSDPRVGQPLTIRESQLYQRLLKTRHDFVVTPLFWSESAADYRMLIARWLKGPTGQVVAVGMARIDPHMLIKLVEQLELVSGESVAIVDERAQLLARRPASSFHLGDVIEATGTIEFLSDGALEHQFTVNSPVDDQRRLYVTRRVGGLPLWVVLGQSTSELLTGLVERLWPLLLTSLLLALLGWLLLRHLLAQWRIEQILRREVVERQKAEQDAQREEAQLQALINSMQDMVFVLTVDGRFSYAHAGDESLLLVPPEEMIGSHYRDLLPEPVSQHIGEAVERLAASGEPQRVDYRLELESAPAWFSALLTPVLDASGRMGSILAVVRDITEDRAQQVQLSIAATAFETHLGMMITDESRAILKVNRTFTQITGYTEAEVFGQNPRMLSAGRHDAAFYQRLWQQIDTRGSWQGEIWNRRKNGEIYPQWLTISAVRDDRGILTHYVGTLSDITERKAAEREIHQLAFYDPLTGLANRRLMLDRLEQALISSEQSGEYGALLLLDLDNFKQVNDSLGHHGGDDILLAAARRISSALDDSDMLARLGGDEFVALIREQGSDERGAGVVAQCKAQKLLSALATPLVQNQSSFSLSACIGIALFRDQVSTDALQSQAEMALYQAKSLGSNQVCFFDPELQARLLERTQLENDLGLALEKRQLFLVYQRQVDEHGDVVGAEALLRWRHPERGLVSPVEFIPLAEGRELIHEIGLWVIESVCGLLVSWAQQPALAELTLSVNVSPRQFQDPTFVEQVREILARTGAPASQLKLEVTESLFVDDRDDIRRMMEELKSLGVTFSLDDFGTGYSSLSYLKRLPLDQIKVDQSFVRDLLDNSTSSAIVASTIALAQTLELEVIAEGVETEEQRAWLLQHGCLRFQGYLFGAPVPLDDGISALR